jgi:phosphoglucosamine mutase
VEQVKIFGTDGVRGRANVYPMTVEVALALGRAAGRVFHRHEGKHRVVIGKDTRLSCYMFENALISGLCSMGVDTLMLGPFPTPGVAFITRAYRADAGIVISASHNTYYDNGIKFFSSEGFKLGKKVEDEIEELVLSNNFEDCLPADQDIGRNSKVRDADGRYIEFAKSAFPKHMTLNKMRLVLDCSNGAAYRIAPHVFWELGAEVFTYGAEPNGLNINLNCGSLQPEYAQKKVIDHNAHAGIILDGDGDRVILVDEKGQVADGDVILGIIAQNLKEKGLLANDRVVATVMSNFGLISSLEEMGIEVIQSKVGDRHVIREMLDNDAILGGEQSGHIICLEHNTTGDSLVAALQVLAIMIEKDKPLSELRQVVKSYPQRLVNVVVSSKPPLESLTDSKKEVERAERELGGNGRVLVRYSGTENICRVMCEGPDIKTVEKYAAAIAKSIENEIGKNS